MRPILVHGLTAALILVLGFADLPVWVQNLGSWLTTAYLTLVWAALLVMTAEASEKEGDDRELEWLERKLATAPGSFVTGALRVLFAVQVLAGIAAGWFWFGGFYLAALVLLWAHRQRVEKRRIELGAIERMAKLLFLADTPHGSWSDATRWTRTGYRAKAKRRIDALTSDLGIGAATETPAHPANQG